MSYWRSGSSEWIYFLQCTDTHLRVSAEDTQARQSPQQGLSKIVQYALDSGLPLDFVLHTGDVAGALGELGQPSSYDECDQLLAPLKKPVAYVAGNHDDPRELRRRIPTAVEWFSDDPSSVAYSFQSGEIRFFVLDARIGEAPHSRISEGQLDWLHAGLGAIAKNGAAVVVTHYQVLPIDIPRWHCVDYDGAPSSMLMENGEALHAVLSRHRAVVAGVFHGHIHSSQAFTVDGVTYHAAPSTIDNVCNLPDDRAVDDTIGANLVGIRPGSLLVRHLRLAR
ncbi:MAG: metallophosphoesterase [Bdellovibrionales bacterium]|nr:metallophosphoesterase [Bdellovibrionales bacterium]